MRIVIAIPALLVAGAMAFAQQGAPQAPNPNPAQLDQVLLDWERTLMSMRSLQADCQRTTLDKTFQTKEVFRGTAKFSKAPTPGQGSQASLELYKMGPKGPNPMVFEKYICTGTYLYEYAPASKVIRIHDLPKTKGGQISDDNFLSFLFGMRAVDAKERYQIALTPPSDQFYHYLHIQPKLAQDKADFSTAQLVLRRDNFLPRRVWFQQPNGNETTWDFDARSNVDIPPTTFEKPNLPRDWQWDRMQGDAKPKVRGYGP